MDNYEEGADNSDDGCIVRCRGLPWSATAQEIVNFFSDCKIIDGVDGVHLTYNREGRQSGEAYVEMESQEDITQALTKHNEHMGRRYVEVFRSKRSEMEWVVKRSGTSQQQGGFNKGDAIVRLRGLPFGCSKEEIAQFFTGLEIVPNGITLPTDMQGRTTGDAFVQFATDDIAEKALEKHKQRIGHRYIEIFKSSFPEAKAGMGSIPRLMSLQAQGRMGGAGRPSPYDRNDRYGGGSGNMGGGMGMGGGMASGMGMRGRNIKRYLEEEDYDDDYSGGGMGGMGGGGMGGGMGGMGSMGMNRMRRQQAMMGGGSGGGIGGMGGGMNQQRGRMGMGSPMGQGKGTPGNNYMSSTGHSVHLRGLPFQATEQDIMKFFAPIDVVNVEFEFNNKGKPSGEADTDFASHSDAQEAMKKDRTNMQHRYIELFLNSTPERSSGGNFGGSGRGFGNSGMSGMGGNNFGMGGMNDMGGGGSGSGGMSMNNMMGNPNYTPF